MSLKNLKVLLFAVLLVPSLVLADSSSLSHSKTISVTPTIDTVAYTAGDAIGGLMTFTLAARKNVSSGIIHSVVIADKAQQGADVDLVIFNENPTATTVTNNAAFDPDDADLLKIVCVIPLTSDSAFSDSGATFAAGNNCVFQIPSLGTDLYGVLVARGTPTYASASDLQVRVSILQD